jgi:hypothetical protein
MTESHEQPTDDERAGMDWWNGMTEQQRGAWLETAKSARPADAWAAYKRQRDGQAAPLP